MIDAKATLARDRLRERRDRFLAKVFYGPAGGADQVVMMAGLTPDVGGDVTRSLEPLRQSGADQPIE